MNRWIMTLFVALAALCMSVSSFGSSSVDLYCDTVSESGSPTHGRDYLFATGYEGEFCFEVEAECKGDEVWGEVWVYLDDIFNEILKSLSVMYAADEDGPPDDSCSMNSLDFPLYLGLATKEWSMKCRFAGKGSYEVKISSVKMKYCED